MNTLQLTSSWDLYITPEGNLSILTGNPAIVQDVCSACRTWQGEPWYNNQLGVPYLQTIMAKRPTLNTVKNLLNTEALRVPGVASTTIYLVAFADRNVGGQIQITGQTGATIGIVQTMNIGQPWWISAASRGAVGATT